MGSRGFSAIFIPVSIGVVVLLIIGMYLLLMGGQKPIQPVPQNNPPKISGSEANPNSQSIYVKRPKATALASATPIPQVTWQKFTGSSITLSYPISWVAQASAAPPQTIIVTVRPYGEEAQVASLFIQETPDSDAMAANIEATRASLGFTKQNVYLTGLPAIKYTGTLPGKQVPLYETNYVIRTRGKLFYIKYMYPQDQTADTYEAIFTHIVTSFTVV